MIRMPTIDKSAQKQINHIFHYTRKFSTIIEILQSDFQPSYCEETISDLRYLIPMISFCNISIKDVELYMHYGNYGIGLTIDWAIRNRISPVIYFHDQSPFNNLHSEINNKLLQRLLYLDINEGVYTAMKRIMGEAINDEIPQEQKSAITEILAEINEITVPALQFFKSWKTQFRDKLIITYLEREWRFVPALKTENRLITFHNPEFAEFKNKISKPKPHLPNYPLRIGDISDIRYFIIKTDNQRVQLIKQLQKKFGKQKLEEAILEGKLMILTQQQIKNDF